MRTLCEPRVVPHAARLSALSRAALASCLLLCQVAIPMPVLADTSTARELFESRCVACHVNGGNVIAPTKTLTAAALERNGYTTDDSIVTLLRNGKGQMPKYQGAIPAISRLTDEQLAELAQFTREQAEKGWSE